MEKERVYLKVLDYSEYPGPRYNNQGPFSGEKFYVEKLNPVFSGCYKNKSALVVNLDRTAGFASSFLDEAFGQLTYDFGESNVKELLNIESIDEPEWPSMIFNETIPQWEKRRQKHETPKSTFSYSVDAVDNQGQMIKRTANVNI